MGPLQRQRLDGDLRRLAEGDRTAFDPVFEALWPVTHRFAARFLGSASEADEAAQRTMVKLMERAADYDGERDGLTWALTLTVWECRTLRRARTRAQRRLAPIDAVDDRCDQSVPHPDDALGQAQLLTALDAAVCQLDEADRAALGRDVSRQAAQDLAEQAPATRRKRRQRALARLKNVWRTLYGTA